MQQRGVILEAQVASKLSLARKSLVARTISQVDKINNQVCVADWA